MSFRIKPLNVFCCLNILAGQQKASEGTQSQPGRQKETKGTPKRNQRDAKRKPVRKPYENRRDANRQPPVLGRSQETFVHFRSCPTCRSAAWAPPPEAEIRSRFLRRPLGWLRKPKGKYPFIYSVIRLCICVLFIYLFSY